MKDKYALLTGKFQGRNDEKMRGKKNAWRKKNRIKWYKKGGAGSKQGGAE